MGGATSIIELCHFEAAMYISSSISLLKKQALGAVRWS